MKLNENSAVSSSLDNTDILEDSILVGKNINGEL